MISGGGDVLSIIVDCFTDTIASLFAPGYAEVNMVLLSVAFVSILYALFGRNSGDSKDRWIRNNWQLPADKMKHREMRKAWKESLKRNNNYPKRFLNL